MMAKQQIAALEMLIKQNECGLNLLFICPNQPVPICGCMTRRYATALNRFLICLH